ncbi:MAG: hypothetical protein O3B13_21235, partial [Planctomycetota bacterium]|nr:hypothetical protein [Planctomycetota bacterium]
MRHAKGHRTTAYAIEQRRESGGYEARKVNPFGRVARHCMTTRQYLNAIHCFRHSRQPKSHVSRRQAVIIE